MICHLMFILWRDFGTLAIPMPALRLIPHCMRLYVAVECDEFNGMNE
jgi:hypothetical protein